MPSDFKQCYPEFIHKHFTSDKTFKDYSEAAASTATYPGQGEFLGLVYTALGVAGEAGEFADKVKKLIRDKSCVVSPEDQKALLKELGDVLWYCDRAAHELGSSLQEVTNMNEEKLASRKDRGVLGGSGDER